MWPLRTRLTRWAEKAKHASVPDERHRATSNPCERSLVDKETLYILSSVDVPCSRNHASQNEGALRITEKRCLLTDYGVSRGPGSVLSPQRRNPDGNQQETCECLHCYLPLLCAVCT